MKIGNFFSLRHGFAISFAYLVLSSSAFACPKIGAFNLADYNCDQQFKFVFTGDSIAKGVGDDNNDGKGGYVKRTKQFFGESDVSFINLGVSGITTGRLLREFKRNLTKNKAGKTQEAIFDADAVMVDCARNDYWQNRLTQSDSQRAQKAVRNLVRIGKLLTKKTRKDGKEAFVFFATMLPTTRSFQAGFLNQVNKRMLRASKRKEDFRVLLRFDKKFKSRFLREDGLHPSSKGYDRITDGIIIPFIEGKFQEEIAELRHDADADGVYDEFEAGVYGTSPNVADSDGDGVDDATELFVNGTDPLDPLSV